MNLFLMQFLQFSTVYLLLLLILFIMKRCRIEKTGLLLMASAKMTIQLILSGWVLTYLFDRPNSLWTGLYLFVMMAFSIHRVLSKNPGLSPSFRFVIGLSMTLGGVSILAFFVMAVARRSFFDPQYVIPLGGMLLGNAMNSVSLGIKTFRETLVGQQARMEALACLGADSGDILLPFVIRALETAMVPTLNSMVGMGIVSLPGMMTGQILAGAPPLLAILYQISIMIAHASVVTLTSFASLYAGARTLYDKKTQMIRLPETKGHCLVRRAVFQIIAMTFSMQHDKMKHIDACHENGMANRLRGDASSRPQDKRLIIRGPQGIPLRGPKPREGMHQCNQMNEICPLLWIFMK